MIRAAAKNHAFAAVVVRARELRRRARGAARRRRHACRCRRASGSRPRRSPTPRATTRRSRAGSPRGRRTSRSLHVRAYEKRRSTCPTARTRTSAPPSTSRSARARHVLSHGAPAPRQGALVQQPARPRRRPRARPRLRRAARLRDRQAQQPLRRRGRQRPARRLRARLRGRPGQRLRRDRRAQPAGRPPRRRRRSSEQFVEVLLAPGFEEDALEALQAKPNVRLLEDEERRGPDPRERDVRQVEGGLLVQDRDRRPSGTRPRGRRHEARTPTEAEWRDLLFAWRGLRAREVQRDRAGPRRRDRRRRRRPDEPGRLGPHRRREGRPTLAGRRAGLRRVLPVPRRPRARARAGVTAIIQPGGSSRDERDHRGGDEHGIAMVLTGRRHFRH